mmetsp:Transcript_8218/g.21531  ORF Transcript_8218/g.21531 Transcript_8218/m.21531 type:complete len:293 (-) Transcript_8218:335-1213(-)
MRCRALRMPSTEALGTRASLPPSSSLATRRMHCSRRACTTTSPSPSRVVRTVRPRSSPSQPSSCPLASGQGARLCASSYGPCASWLCSWAGYARRSSSPSSVPRCARTRYDPTLAPPCSRAGVPCSGAARAPATARDPSSRIDRLARPHCLPHPLHPLLEPHLGPPRLPKRKAHSMRKPASRRADGPRPTGSPPPEATKARVSRNASPRESRRELREESVSPSSRRAARCQRQGGAPPRMPSAAIAPVKAKRGKGSAAFRRHSPRRRMQLAIRTAMWSWRSSPCETRLLALC